MQTRQFGRSGHMSSLAILGGFAFSAATQAETDASMEKVIAAGVNHFDIAPSYGHAEERVGPWIKRYRQDLFIGCKTTERSRSAAEAELHSSLKRLQTDHFDLYQIHAITTLEELDQATRPGGALEAMVAARAAGLTHWIGITGHGLQAPALFLEALRRFDFDSVLFPVSFILYGNKTYRQQAEELLAVCRARQVGTMAIKHVAKGPWGDLPHTHNTWYQPFTDPEAIQQAVNFSLSQDITGLCTAGDRQVMEMQLTACEQFEPMPVEQQEALIANAGSFEPLFS